MKTLTAIAKHIRVRGVVQGVGFRPFVYRLATRHGVAGEVRNRRGDVEITVQGDEEAVESFLRALRNNAPAAARIENVIVREVEPADRVDFRIGESATGPNGTLPISPDIATCDECLRELFDPDDRRYRYPFITCAHCGPRYTIVHSVPYDRERTSMANFTMCAACRDEYDDPADRRFHAQAIACPECGPRVSVIEPESTEIRDQRSEVRDQSLSITTLHLRPPTSENDPIRIAAAAIRDGRIVAVKGLGGYHLAVDATNETAVAELHRRKFRERKPFAVMARDLEDVGEFCELTAYEQRLLVSPRRPIVLLRRWDRSRLAGSICGGLPDLGVILAYTPLHHLLLADLEELTGRPALLVMTSGNRSNEPIARDDDEALRTLGEIADVFLMHDRPIVHRCDDTVTRCLGQNVGQTFLSAGTGRRESLPHGTEMVLRRSRGDVPRPVAVSFEFSEPVLACGARQKNTVCLGTGGRTFLSLHIGDLENYETLRAFEESIETLKRFTRTEPRIIARDLHPEYLSTKYALDQDDVRTVEVQHHHAHIASVLAEHGLNGPVIGIAFDGTGYGTDGGIWGGEFLIADRRDFTRTAHLDNVPLPGGEQAIRQPWRMAAVYLQRAFGEEFLHLDLPFVRSIDPAKWHPLKQMIDRELNCPLTSSIGRLFDAVAAIVLARNVVSFEGQAAMELEAAADGFAEVQASACLTVGGMTVGRTTDSLKAGLQPEGYEFSLRPGEPAMVDPLPVIRAIVNDLQTGVARDVVAGRFHAAVAHMSVAVTEALRSRHQLDEVALSGGVFQNRLLTEMTFALLEQAGFKTFTNNRIPVNDGGIAFGQAAVAAARLER